MVNSTMLLGKSFHYDPTRNAANEITAINGQPSIVSDKTGNMTCLPKPENWSKNLTLTYDAWNRLVKVADGATHIAAYTYDAINRRVKKALDTEMRAYYYNRRWQCAEEYINNSQVAQYLWGLRYIDDLIRVSLAGQWLNVLADTNWNVVALTSGTTVVERYTYNTFGKRSIYDANFTLRATSSYPAFTRTFTGQVLDNETDLMLYRMRYYHPALGRFIQRDPIGYAAEDMNLYRYVRNVSVLGIDSMGTAPFLPPVGEPGFTPKPGQSLPEHYWNKCKTFKEEHNLGEGDTFSVTFGDEHEEEEDDGEDCCKSAMNLFKLLAKNNGLPIVDLGTKCSVTFKCEKCPEGPLGVFRANLDRNGMYVKGTLVLCANSFVGITDPDMTEFYRYFLHELTHAFQYCRIRNINQSCGSSQEREIEANYCSGLCHNFHDCLDFSINSICAASDCKEEDFGTERLQKLLEWYEEATDDRIKMGRFRKLCSTEIPDPPVPPKNSYFPPFRRF